MRALALFMITAWPCSSLGVFSQQIEAAATTASIPQNNNDRHEKNANANDAAKNNFIIGGYLPEYRSYINLNATSIHLTDLILFSLTPESILQYSSSTTSSTLSCCLSSEHYNLMRKAKTYKKEQQQSYQQTNVNSQTNNDNHNQLTPELRLLITVGGGGRSQGFVDVIAGNSQIKKQFLKGLRQLCEDEHADGIDLDFEGIQSMQQWNAYLNLLTQASSYLHRHDLLLTVALHPGQYLPPEVCQSVDRVHLMTYDMTPQEEQTINHHASLRSVEDAISSFIQHGCPPSKLIMGIPAYARHSQNMGLVKTYSEIIDEFIAEQDSTTMIDESTIDSMQNIWKGYPFDSPKEVDAKVEYAMQNGLGGVFFWELGQDKQLSIIADGGILLEKAAMVVAGRHSTHGGDHRNRKFVSQEL